MRDYCSQNKNPKNEIGTTEYNKIKQYILNKYRENHVKVLNILPILSTRGIEKFDYIRTPTYDDVIRGCRKRGVAVPQNVQLYKGTRIKFTDTFEIRLRKRDAKILLRALEAAGLKTNYGQKAKIPVLVKH